MALLRSRLNRLAALGNATWATLAESLPAAKWAPPKIAALVSAALFLLLLLTYILRNLSHAEISARAAYPYTVEELLFGVETGLSKRQPSHPKDGKVLLPAGFNFDKATLKAHLQGTSAENWPWRQLGDSQVKPQPPIETNRWHTESTKVFDAAQDVFTDQCNSALGMQWDVTSDDAVNMPCDLQRVFRVFLQEMDDYDDAYNKFVARDILRHVRAELFKGVMAPYWFRFSGSSVWLKDYNVHYVVSRLSFSEVRDRRNPKLSFALVQIFDEHWREINDVRLVVPTNDVTEPDAPVFFADDQTFTLHRYPRLLAVPFFQPPESSRLLGPEDPRVMLVKNKYGYEEPIVVYNAFFVKKLIKDGMIDVVGYRLMFITFAFQLQKGHNMDEMAPLDLWFARTKELAVGGEEKEENVKNWTPFISEFREKGDYDRFVYLATNLENIKVLKCDLDSDDSQCEIIYGLSRESGVLRGGTAFVNLNRLLAKTNHPVRKLIPVGREILVGFARARLPHCGCSQGFYRPNLVVITKDEALYFDEQSATIKTKYFFKITHVSSFFSLGMTIYPWRPEDPNSLCGDYNVLIPNGIAAWNIDAVSHNGDRWHADDTLSLLVSVSDSTVDRVNLRGVLDFLMNTKDNSLFLSPPKMPRNENIKLPRLNRNGNLIVDLPGLSDTNIICAVDESSQFCKNYAFELRPENYPFTKIEITHALDRFEDQILAIDRLAGTAE